MAPALVTDAPAHPALAPFRLAVPQATLDDLGRRLSEARLPAAIDAAPWQWGADASFMQALLARWRDGFDWRAWEARVNAHPQFMARIEGGDVHVLIERGSGPRPLPLILTHGWPGSLFELIELVEPLAHPERHGGSIEDAFTVVIASLPGFGLSPAPSAPLRPQDVAAMWRVLMEEALGFDRYVAHGGDTGAAVTSWLGIEPRAALPAIHLTNAVMFPDWTLEARPPDAIEADYLARQQRRSSGEDAYQRVHAEKPATIAYALADSPIGLAAWIAEKFHGWTSPGAPVPRSVAIDHILANVMVYWTGRSHPAHWMYQSFRDLSGYRLPEGRRIETPTGFALFPDDIVVPPPRRWIERAYRVARLTVAEDGGHFPGVEAPARLVAELRSFFRGYR